MNRGIAAILGSLLLAGWSVSAAAVEVIKS